MVGKLTGSRQPEKVRHTIRRLLFQQMLVVALHYKDVNDHDSPCDDIALQAVREPDAGLAKLPPTRGICP